jgi:hypothetical protein
LKPETGNRKWTRDGGQVLAKRWFFGVVVCISEKVGKRSGGVSPGGWSRKPVLDLINIGDFEGRTRTVTRTVAY